MNTDPDVIAATLDAGAKLTVALEDHRIIPDPDSVHDAADHLRTVTSGSFFDLLGAAAADAADHRVADSTVDTHAADGACERLLDRLELRCRLEESKHLDAIDTSRLTVEQVDQVAAAYRWVDAVDDDTPPPAA